jgi:hypothetical protein
VKGSSRKKWREMVQRVILEMDKIQQGERSPITVVRSPVAWLLERESDFSSLEPLLTRAAVGGIDAGTTFIAGPTIDSKLVLL